MIEHFRTGPIPRRHPRTTATAPPLTGADVIALRQRAGLTQRMAADAAGVSRGLVGELERPRSQRFRGGVSPQAGAYLAWLRRQAAQAAQAAQADADAGVPE